MPIQIDFTGVTDEGFEVLEPGIYDANLYNIKQEVGKESGKPYLSFEFVLPTQNKRHLWSNFSLQPQALWRLKQVLVVLGVPAEQLVGSLAFEPSDLLGKAVRLRVTIEDYQGRSQNAVADILASSTTEAVSPATTAGAIDRTAKKKQRPEIPF